MTKKSVTERHSKEKSQFFLWHREGFSPHFSSVGFQKTKNVHKKSVSV
jgi:hypothetical protein